VRAEHLVASSVHRVGDVLHVNGKEYVLNNNLSIVGFGKAVYGMAVGVQKLLSDHIVEGYLSVPHGFKPTDSKLLDPTSYIKVSPGAKDNLPDAEAMQSAVKIQNIINSLTRDDVGIVLISGGGSALLPLPVPQISLEEKLLSINTVAKAGGNIKQLNLMRQKLSQIKGGKLLESCACTNIIALIISDIVGDPVDLIASGPTVCNTSTFTQCIDIFNQLKVNEHIPKSVMHYLSEMKNTCDNDEYCNIQKQSESLRSCNNVLVGSNTILVRSAHHAAIQCAFQPVIVTNKLECDAQLVGTVLAELAVRVLFSEGKTEIIQLLEEITCDMESILHADLDNMNKVCLIFAGETTVNVKGTGCGGRNQHIVLSALSHWKDLSLRREKSIDFSKICLLSAGTDGQDGATDAAGAVCDGAIVGQVVASDLNVQSYLSNCASNDFFESYPILDGLIKTGLTGTNVMDIQIVLVDKSADD